jgi:methionine aminotransferase
LPTFKSLKKKYVKASKYWYEYLYSNVTVASEYNAINLSQVSNFPVDERLTNIVARLAKGCTSIPSYGWLSSPSIKNSSFSPELLWQNPNQNLVLSRGNTSHFATIQALVDTDDEVIILDPSYDCYEAPVLLCKSPFVLRLMIIPLIGKDRKSMFL